MRQHIYQAIEAERERQDAKWGGPEHDTQHMPVDWQIFIAEHTGKAVQSFYGYPSGDPSAYRQRMIEVAALAVAAIEAHDRSPNRD